MKTSKANILSEETQSNTPFFMKQGGEHSFFHTAIQPKPSAADQAGPHEEETLAGARKGSSPEPVKSFSGATPPGNNIAIQKKCAECEEEEMKEKEGPVVQRKEENATTPPTDPVAQPVPVVTPATATPQARFIVEDGESPGEGQMRKSEFLGRLKREVEATVNNALTGTAFTADNCPYLRASFERHQGSSPAQIEALIQRYAPDTANAVSAEGIIQSMKTRVYSAALQWVMAGGNLPDPMSAFGNIATGISSTMGNIATGIGNMFFKADAGGAKATQSPQAVMHSLGKGRPMESSTRSKMEGAFGTSFSDVEIHTDNKAEQLSAGMNARAFTVGKHIAFAGGEHKPGSVEGDVLMAHELAHTIQQSGASQNGMQMKNDMDHSALEQDADTSALGAVVSMQQGKKGSLKELSKKSSPRMKTGLGITSCRSATRTPCTAAELATINGLKTTAGGWVSSALTKLRASPVRADVTTALQRNFGPTAGVAANIPAIITTIVTANSEMTSVPVYCAGTEKSLCAGGSGGFNSWAGAHEYVICRNTTLTSTDPIFPAATVLHESFHTANSAFDGDSYSGWNGHSSSSSGYPGSDPLNNADSYTTLILDLR